jgi:protein FAM50
MSTSDSPAPSRGDTPGANNLRFTPQLDAEDLLKASTEGLVTLSDFRKRRNNAFEQRAGEGSNAVAGATT